MAAFFETAQGPAIKLRVAAFLLAELESSSNRTASPDLSHLQLVIS
jgi:hypothetical protein